MGRRPALDVEQALPRIVRLFWRHGYGGMTLDQIAAELGVTKPTLFRTFGDKDDVFAEALKGYYLEFIKPGVDRLEAAPTLRSAVTACFDVAVDRMMDDLNPLGCFLTDTAVNGGVSDGVIAEMLTSLQGRVMALLEQKIDAAIRSGELDEATEPQAALHYILAQMAALSALSHQGGASGNFRVIASYMIEGLPWACRRFHNE